MYSCKNSFIPPSLSPLLSMVVSHLRKEKDFFMLTSTHFMDILTPKQYGFCHARAITDYVVDLIKEITATLDKGNNAVSLFLDLSKAFDFGDFPQVSVVNIFGTTFLCQSVKNLRKKII